MAHDRRFRFGVLDPAGARIGRRVGYRLPLFLGATDRLENLELIDIDAYWTLTAQMRAQAGEQPDDA